MDPLKGRGDSRTRLWARSVVVALVFVMVVSALAVFTTPARAVGISVTAAPNSSTGTTVGANPSPAAATPRILKMGWIAMQIGTTNPIHITLDDEYPVVYNVYSTLITYDPQYNYMPDLALKWWVYNSTAYEMYLAPNAYFIDPRAPNDLSHRVTGEDVKWSYETFSQNVNQMDLFTDYVREVEGVWVDPANPFHIIINFKIPYAPAMETFGTMFILPKYIWQNETLSYSNPLPIGSGPFMVRPDPAHPDKMLKPPPVLYLDKNPHWHGPAALGQQVFPDVLEIDSYTTSAAMSQDLVLGVIDTVMSPEPTEWTIYLANKPGIIRQAVPHAFVAEVGINLMTPALRATNPQRFRGTNSPLLQNQVVRVAIQMITNRQKMIDNALLGLGEKADTLVPKVSPWHYDFPNYASTMPAWQNESDPIIGPYTALEEFPDNTPPSSLPANDPGGPQYSTYLARALLMKEGWRYDSAGNPATLTTTPLCKPGGSDCLVFRFYTLSDVSWWKTAADGMVADAARAGIVLNLALYGTTQMNNQIWWPMDYDIWLWDWMFTPAADPSTGILAVETCENLINGTSNDNGFCLIDKATGHWVYDDLYNQSVRETDPAKRRVLTDEMQAVLYQYGGYSLPFYRKEVYAMNELRWTHWGDWASQPGLPEDVGTNALIGQYVWPVDHKPPQVADLPAYTGVAGHPVQFSTVATDPNGVALTYNWDFADAALTDDTNHDGIWTNDPDATTAIASHTYPNAGVYNVTLRVSETGSGAEWFTVKRTTATIVTGGTGSPVVSGLTYGPEDPVTTDPEIAFSAAAYDPAGNAMTYAWDFGDGSTAPASSWPNVTHHFASANDFTVTVTVHSAGGDAQRSAIVSVAENVAPVVSPLSDQQATEGNLVTFTGFATDPNSRDFLNYSWDFGDGSPASTQNPVTHTYSAQGGSPTPYTVTLSVTDTPPGASAPLHTSTVTALITVIPRGPNQVPVWSSFTAEPSAPTTTQDVTFTLTAKDPEGDPLHWSITFDCSLANPLHCPTIDWTKTTPQSLPGQLITQTVTHRYTTSGSFRAVAFVDDTKKNGNITMPVDLTVTANHVPTLQAISPNPASPIPTEVVTFSSLAYDQDGDPLSFEWSFGDSSYDRGVSPQYGGTLTTTHAYADVGTYTVILTVDDLKGGTAEVTYEITVAQQNRPPTVSAIRAPAYALVGSPVDFQADVGDLNGDTLSFSWDYGDGTSPDTGTTPVPETLTGTHTFAAEGTFTVSLSLDDGNGGTVSTTTSIIASTTPPTDTTPPTTAHSISGTAGSGTWYTSEVTVTLTASDDLNTVPWTNYTLDSGADTPYTAPIVISADGTHTLEFYSTDAVYNVETTQTVSIDIDKTPPTMTHSVAGPTTAGWYTGTATVTLTADDAMSGLAAQTYRIDSGTWTDYTTPFDVIADGRHVVDYRAVDNAGLVYTNTINVNLDLSAPVTSAVVSGTAGLNGWYTSAVSISLSGVDTLSGVASTFYRVDGGAWTQYSAAFGVATEGTHTVEFNSTDNAGHVETTVNQAVDNDTLEPDTTAALSGTPTGGWYAAAVTVTLTSTDESSGVASIQYQLDSTTWQTYGTAVAVSGDGAHAFAYRATDNAGIVEATHTATINVDTLAPSTMISIAGTAGANGWYTSAVTVTLTASDSGSGVGSVWYRLNSGTWSAYSTAVPIAADGTTTVEYNATDVVGHSETTHSQTVNIDTVAPAATLTVPTADGNSGWFKTMPTVSVSGTDSTSGVATMEYKTDGGAWQTTTGAVPVAQGTHTLTVRVTDTAGLVSSEQSATVKVDTVKPTVDGLTPTGTVNTGTVTIYWTGADATSGIAEYKVAVDGGTATSTGTTNSTTLTLADGAHTIDVTATDAAGNTATRTLQLTVSTGVAPSGGLDTMTIIVIVVVVAAAALGAVWFVIRRKKAGPPSEPPVAPPEP